MKLRIRYPLFFLLLLPLAAGPNTCGQNPVEDYPTATPVQEATPLPTAVEPAPTLAAPEPAAPADQEGSAAAEGNVRIIFNFSGENPSYHTGLRNRTFFYVDREAGVVTANETRTFEEPFGAQTSRGSDTVTFSGTYDPEQDGFSGTLTITTEATNSGAGAGTSTISYTMSGTLSAVRMNDEWQGTVTGAAQLIQRWPGGEFSDEVSDFPVSWEISGFDTDW